MVRHYSEQNAGRVVLKLANGLEQRLPTDEIASVRASEHSLIPAAGASE